MNTHIAVLIPCFNEEHTVGKVVLDFKTALPDATIYVYNNNSTDRTAEAAKAAGAVVAFEPVQGKGNVVKRMFLEIDADLYVLVDGDDTYEASRVAELMEPVVNGHCDMAVASRIDEHKDESYRRFHKFGNKLIRLVVNRLFQAQLSDILSGFRCFNKRFVKSIPLLSKGFEVETELTIQALDKGLRIKEIVLPYGERPAGSQSKLRTFKDGFRILLTIFNIFKDYKPLAFFFVVSMLFLGGGGILGWSVVSEFTASGRIVHLSRAILSVSLLMVSFVTLITGILLDTINRRYKELYVLMTSRSLNRQSDQRVDVGRRLENSSDVKAK